MTATDLLLKINALYILSLERTGLLPRLCALDLPVIPELRPLVLAVLATSVVLALYAALASGPDPAVRLFRALAVLAAASLPLAALRLVGSGREAAFTGFVLVLLVGSALLHRALARRRREGPASRAIQRLRWVAEVGGLLLFTAGFGLLVIGRGVPVPLAFWALFLLRLSIADLLDPPNMAAELGLPGSAARDLAAAVSPKGKRRRAGAGQRLAHALKGIGKTALLLLWLALPLLAALERESFPVLALYPAGSLLLTGLFLLYRSARDLRGFPLDALRGAVAGLGTLLYLGFAYRDPAFAAYQHTLPSLVVVETLFAFLLGAATRR